MRWRALDGASRLPLEGKLSPQATDEVIFVFRLPLIGKAVAAGD